MLFRLALMCFIKLKKKNNNDILHKHEQFIQHPHISNKNKQLRIIHSNQSWRFYIVVFRKPRQPVHTFLYISIILYHIHTTSILLATFTFQIQYTVSNLNVHNPKIQHTSSIQFHSLSFCIIAYHFDKIGVQLSQICTLSHEHVYSNISLHS